MRRRLPPLEAAEVSIRIKICGIASAAEAKLAIRYGASMLGLSAEHSAGSAPLEADEIAHIAAMLPPGVTATLLTHRTAAADILALQQQCRVGAVQLLSPTTPAVRETLYARAPGIQLLQVVPLTARDPHAAIRQAAHLSNAIVLDAGHPSDTAWEPPSRPRDWRRCREIVRAAAAVPIVLAGGLTGDTVRAAIRAVRPYGVDAGAELRTDGRLDAAALAVFASGVSHAARSGSTCVSWPG